MQFASLGSGSKGNATVVRKGSTRLMIDCGFSLRETERRLARLGEEAANLTAILVTHEHADHIRGVGPLARKFSLPVLITRGTANHQGLGKLPQQQCIDVDETLVVGAFEIQPYPVPHDAREPCQYVIDDGNRRFGMLTDTGSLTEHIKQSLSACDALLLECNHDREMLKNGPYPYHLKQRVSGRFGHLSNDQAAELLQHLDTTKLKHLVAAHLSEQNNTPEFARQALSAALGCEEDWISVADQHNGLGWRHI